MFGGHGNDLQKAEAAASLLLMSCGMNELDQMNLKWRSAYEQLLQTVYHQYVEQQEQANTIAPKEESVEPEKPIEILPNPNKRLLNPKREANRKRKIQEVAEDTQMEYQQQPVFPTLQEIIDRPAITTLPTVQKKPQKNPAQNSISKNSKKPRIGKQNPGRKPRKISRKNLLYVRKKVYYGFLNDEAKRECLKAYAAYKKKEKRLQKKKQKAKDQVVPNVKHPRKKRRMNSYRKLPFLLFDSPTNQDQNQGHKMPTVKFEKFKSSHYKKALISSPNRPKIPFLRIPNAHFNYYAYPRENPDKLNLQIDYRRVYFVKRKMELVYAMHQIFTLKYCYNPNKSRYSFEDYVDKDPQYAIDRAKNNFASRRSRQRKKFQFTTLGNATEFNIHVMRRNTRKLGYMYKLARMTERETAAGLDDTKIILKLRDKIGF